MINTTSNFFRSSPLMQLMTNAAFKASKRLIRDFGEVEKLEVSRKSVKDFVSTADLTSERTIVEELKTARPNFSFLTEEKGYVEGKNKNACFIIACCVKKSMQQQNFLFESCTFVNDVRLKKQ